MTDLDQDSDEIDEISDWFWDILHRAEQDPDKLREILMALDRSQVTRFLDEYDAAAIEFMEAPHTYYLDEPSRNSEDEIDYLARWVVSQGKEHYTRVLENPELMPLNRDGIENPYCGVAVDVENEKRESTGIVS